CAGRIRTSARYIGLVFLDSIAGNGVQDDGGMMAAAAVAVVVRVNHLIDSSEPIKWVGGQARVEGVILVPWNGVSCDARTRFRDAIGVFHDQLIACAAAYHRELPLIRRFRKSGNTNESIGWYRVRKVPGICGVSPRRR